jgi:DNA-binding NtrC family response regulator
MPITRVTNQLAPSAAAQRCRMRVIGDSELEIAIPPVGFVVGSDPSADVALADPSVSRRHCTVVPTEAGFDVTDLGSRNGTFLEGVALTRAIVPVGSTLRVGKTLLQLIPEEIAVELSPSTASSFGNLFGSSLAMRQAFSVLERASSSDASVLLIGESGTGKELAARAVHEASRRRQGPFVVFDCGASSESLIESDLFGHRKGAFTGAVTDRPGAFQQAHGGTLFLDEIGDLPLSLQPKLLRLLEAGEVTALGAQKSEHYDVRIVAATHRDLWAEVGRGTFRGDLYYRLAVIEPHLPPLRHRLDDLPELVRRFLAMHGVTINLDAIAGPNLARLCAYHWPGNVRELRNVIARGVALSQAATDFSQMPILLRAATSASSAPTAAPATADRPFHEAKDEVVLRFEREYLTDLLRRAGGSMAEAARRAGLERKYLYKVLERVGIPRPNSDRE